MLDGRHTSSDKSQYCRHTAIMFDASVIIKGFRGIPIIGCQDKKHQPTLLFMNNTFPGPARNVTLQNVNLINTLVLVDNINLTVDSSIVNDSRIMSIDYNNQGIVPYLGFNFLNSIWRGFMDPLCNQTGHCLPSSVIMVASRHLDLYYKHSYFYQTVQKMRVFDGSDFRIEDTVISNMDGELAAHGGVYLTIMGGVGESNVHVEDSIFEKQIYDNPIESVMNLHQAALVVNVKAREYVTNSNVSCYIKNVQFHDNERGITFVGPFKKLLISDCSIKRNIAMHAGAGILFFTNPPINYTVDNCTFESNAAGNFRPEKILAYGNSFQVSGDEVRIRSSCCKGVISFVGKGGAIRVQRGGLTLNSSTFKNNTARLLGGALFVDKEGRLDMEDTYFENSPDGQHAMQGDLLYSDGLVTLRSAKMFLHTAMNHIAVVRHSGNHWSIEVRDVFVQCPIGNRLRVTNTSAYGVDRYGLRRSHKMDQLSYFCESCPRNKYSLDYGYLNYSLVYSEFAYFTLLINGTEPPAAYTGNYVHHDIECLECPYGGKCQLGITAVPNFWGYIKGSTVMFQHCPKGYCCGDTNCQHFSTCATHRSGRLCGTCESGYSEALFSSQCVPDDQCNPTWLWPVALGSGFLYALFLLFQKDMRDMMFMQGVSLQEIQTLRKEKNHPLEMNHIIHEDNVHSPLAEQAELETLQTEADLVLEDGPLNNSNGPIENNNQKSDKDDEDDKKADGPPPDTGAGFLIILFFYFQDAQLLNVKTVFASSESKSKSMIKTVLSGLFKFRIELFQFMDKVCFIKDITPSVKLMVKAVLVPYVLLQFGVLYIIYLWCHAMKRPKQVSWHREEEEDAAPKKTFVTRLSQGFVLALLFTYQKLASTSFTLLKCVPVGEESVLFVEGTIACYQVWQYGVMAYTASCIVPFCLILWLGPGLLKDGLISLPQFFCACIVPLPFLIYWVTLRLYKNGQRPENPPTLSGESQAVIQILQGPFKDVESKMFGPTCGQGLLIARRLILVVLHTFVSDPLIRMLCMMLICFIMLLHHVHVLPFKDTKGNMAGSASAAALLVVGGVNLVRAGFEAAEYVPQGPNETLMYVFEEFENVLMLWFPMAVMCLVFLSVSIKLSLMAIRCSLTRQRDSHVNSSLGNDGCVQ